MSNAVLHLTNATIFQKENLILDDVTVSIEKGEFVYLIGKTGEGNIVGFDLAKLKEKDIPFLRRKLGVVFQDFKLLNDRTVQDNLRFVLKATGWKDKKEMELKIDEVLQKVGMKTKSFKYPYQLSGGEQQRVAIARALLNDPELILADEPTGNLDPQTSVEVMQVLKEINANGNTILMATHDYALILKYPSKTLKCDENQIFEVVQKTV